MSSLLHSFRHVLGGLMSWAAALCCAGAAYGQTGVFFDEFGASPKSAAMGQAFTAVADDASAAYYNPAGLTQIRGIFENNVGYLYARPDVDAHFPGNESIDVHGQPSSRGLLTGIASSLDIEQTIRVFPWFRRFAFGLVSWMNLPEINQYHSGPIASRPHFLRHDMRFQLLALAVSGAFEITPWLSVGAGVMPSVDSVADQDNFSATNKRDDVLLGQRLSIHQTAKVFVVPVFGLLIKPPTIGWRDKLSLGVSFRGENKAHHGKGPLNQVIGVEDENGEPVSGIFYPPSLTINLVSFAPKQLTAGLAIRPFEGWTIAYDMTWKDWSSYQTYLEQAPSPPFEDTFTHRAGVEYAWQPAFSVRVLDRIRQVCFRGGYYFEPTPVQDLIGTDNIFDSDQDVFSAGLSLTLDGKTMQHSLDIFSQYHHFHSESRMAYIDAVYAYLNGLDIRDTYVPVEFGGDVWSVGGSYTIRF
ncbi:MAG: outer membrane protein transport protein [bacterium]